MNRWTRIRRSAGLTQHALGGKARVGRSKIANVETGRAEYTSEELGRVTTVLTNELNRTLDEVSTLLTGNRDKQL